MSDELKPCPFCGGVNVKTRETGSVEYPWEVFCFGSSERACDCAMWGETEERAREEWNTRAAPKVKSLVWSGEFWNTADTPFCTYGVVEIGDERWSWTRSEYPYHETSDPEFKTEDEAKAAAQSDYERRILEALE